MRRVGSMGLVVLVLAGCGPKGEEFVSAEGRFRVTLPGAPKVEPAPGPGRPGAMKAELAVRSGAFTVGWEDVPAKPALSDTDRLDRAVQGALTAIDGKARHTTKFPLEGTECPGRQVVIEKDGKLKMEVRLYMVKGRLYQLIASGEPWWLESPEVRQFFSSFAVTED